MRQVDRAAKAVVRLESEILAERARVLADPRPASYFALFKCAAACPYPSLTTWQKQRRCSEVVCIAACRDMSLSSARHAILFWY